MTLSEQNAAYRWGRRGRRWVRRLIGALFIGALLPCMVIVLLELGLRGAGYGVNTAPFVRISWDDAPLYLRNDAFIQQFFTSPIASEHLGTTGYGMPEQAPPDTFRIFLLGSSAATGWPSPEYGFGSILELMLKHAYPGVRFEVHVLATPGVNSHIMRALAAACVRFRPDLYLIYMGNNEFVGPFGLVQVQGMARQIPDAGTVQRMILMRRLRLGQLVIALREKWPLPRRGTGIYWDGPLAVHPFAPAVLANYRANLDAIFAAARKTDTPVLISTLGANLRDWFPQKGLLANLPETDAADAWRRHFEAGERLRSAGAFAEAAAAYAAAAAIHDAFAPLHFHWARCLLRLGDRESARMHFVRAMDLDGAAFVRVGTAINTIIRETAAAGYSGVRLVDAEAALAAASSDGIPGYDLFNDSCHLNFDGHYVIARAFFDAVVDTLPEWVRQRADKSAKPLEKETCRRIRGHSLDKTIHVLKHFTLMNTLEEEAVQELKTFIEALEGEAAQIQQEISSRDCLEALRMIGPDYLIGMRCADILLGSGEAAAAGEIAAMLLREYPYHYGSHLLQARLLLHAGEYDGAMDSVKRASRLFPDSHQVVMIMGFIHAARGEAEKAASLFRQAIARLPYSWPAYESLTKIYAQRNDFEGMVREWQSMTKQFPDRVLAWYSLGLALEHQGRYEEAIAAYKKTLSRNPGDAGALEALERLGATP